MLAGVFLLKSARNAAFINRVVPGASIPQSIIDRLAAASADPAAEGVAIAAEQVRSYSGIAQGVHLMAVKAEERIPGSWLRRVFSLAGARCGSQLSPLLRARSVPSSSAMAFCWGEGWRRSWRRTSVISQSRAASCRSK